MKSLLYCRDPSNAGQNFIGAKPKRDHVFTPLEHFRGGLKIQLFLRQKKYISICIFQICVQFNFDIHSNQNQQS